MNRVIGGTIAYVAILVVICRLFRHATDPEPCYVDPELAQQVKEALAAEVERQERLASTSELQVIDVDLYDPDDFGCGHAGADCDDTCCWLDDPDDIPDLTDKHPPPIGEVLRETLLRPLPNPDIDEWEREVSQ